MCSLACSLAHSNPVIHLNIGFHGIQRFISACSLAHLSWDKLAYFCMLARSFSPEYAGVYLLARSLIQPRICRCTSPCSLALSKQLGMCKFFWPKKYFNPKKGRGGHFLWRIYTPVTVNWWNAKVLLDHKKINDKVETRPRSSVQLGKDFGLGCPLN